MSIGNWETSTGLIDDYDFTVESARFATDARYNDGQTLLLQWEGKATTADGEILDHTIMFPCGTNWYSPDGGRTAVNPNSTDGKFNRSSYVGRVIDRLVKDFGIAQILVQRGQPTEAKTWEGLSFHIKRETIAFGSGIGDKEREMPTAFLGNGSAPVAAAVAEGENPAVLEAKVRAEAKQATNHQEFVDRVLEKYPEVAKNKVLMGQVIDANGIYASAR